MRILSPSPSNTSWTMMNTTVPMPFPVPVPVPVPQPPYRNGTSSKITGPYYENPAVSYPDPDLINVLAPITAAGWILFGVICVLCVNGRGRAGRWIPEWYLDTKQLRRDKVELACWYFCVLVLWPALLPLLALRSIGSWVKGWKCFGGMGFKGLRKENKKTMTNEGL